VDEMILKQILDKQCALVILWILFKWKIIRFLNKAVSETFGFTKSEDFFIMHHGISHRPKVTIFLKINIYISVLRLL
jgi:hypothetical protein